MPSSAQAQPTALAAPGPTVRLRCEPLLLVVIVLLAASLRLSRLDLIEFKADEAVHLRLAAEVLDSGRLPLVGSRTSFGFDKPPMMRLLLLPPLLLGRDPRLASGWIALLNVAAVAGVFLLGRRYYNLRVATLAGLLFAANPWAVVFSRKIFTADVLAPFLVLALYALHLAVVEGAAWGWPVSLLALGVALNTTFSPLPLLIVWLVLLVLYRRSVRPWPLLTGAGVVFALFLPYLIGQAGAARGGNLLARVLDTVGGEGTIAFASPLQPLRLALDLHAGSGLGALAGAAFAAFAPAHNMLRFLESVAAALFVAAVPALALLWRQGRTQPAAARYPALLLWLLLPVLAVWALGNGAQIHYLVPLFPAGFLAMAVAADAGMGLLVRRLPRRLAAVAVAAAVALLTGLLAWQAYTVFSLYSLVAEHDTAGGYGVPLRRWQALAAMVRHEAEVAGVKDVWVITQGTDTSWEMEPIILSYLLGPDLDAVFLGQGGNDALLLPLDRPGVYLLHRPVGPALQDMLQRLDARQTASLSSSCGSAAAQVLVAPAQELDALLSDTRQRTSYHLEAGPVLEGAWWPEQVRPGDVFTLATYWTWGPVPAEEIGFSHSFFNHILDAQGNRVAQRDGLGLHERHWRQGLLLVQWVDLTLPVELSPGAYVWLTGLYRYQDGVRSPIRDSSGAEMGDSITLGPIHVSP